MINTPICSLLGIRYPVLQGGMAWVSEARLAAAVSNAGGLGVIAAGSMPPELLRREIALCKTLTEKPFGVNVMMMSPYAPAVAQLCADERVAVVTTGAGNPAPYIPRWKDAGIKVVPVIPSAALARRMERAGADAVVAEGCEAGGHIGELTTMCLVPQVCDAVSIPVIAGGGVADSRGFAAAIALGAVGVQMGTAFLCAEECRIHANYKQAVLHAKDTSTAVTGRSVGHPARCLRSRFVRRLEELERDGVSAEELENAMLGSLRRAARDGDGITGCFMAGQCAGLVRALRPAADIIQELMRQSAQRLQQLGIVTE